MSDPIGRWLLVEFLLLLAAFFCTLLGTAFEEASESKLRDAEEEGDRRAARALPRVAEPKRFTAAMRTGAVCFGFFAVYNDMTRTLFGRLCGDGAWAPVFAVLLWLCTALLALAVCMFAPQRCALRRPETLVCRYAGPAALLELICRPALAVSYTLATGLVRLLGVKPADENEEVGEDEILQLVDAGEESGSIERSEKELIENVFAFNNTSAEDIMIHRTDMAVVWEEDTDEEITKTIEESGLSRFPVCGEDVDDIVGILNTRDFLLNLKRGDKKPLKELLRAPHFVPESVKIDVLFRDMQTQKVHMAIVVDEYGGTSGLVTMEDLLEQLVGDIYDEFDVEEKPDISSLGDDTWRIAGSASMEDVADALGLTLDEEDEDEYETLGGLVFSQLSVIPEDGTHPEVEALGLHIKVEEICDRRVEWALVKKLPAPVEADGE